MMEIHHGDGELEIIEFADTITMYDPENSSAWLCISYDSKDTL